MTWILKFRQTVGTWADVAWVAGQAWAWQLLCTHFVNNRRFAPYRCLPPREPTTYLWAQMSAAIENGLFACFATLWLVYGEPLELLNDNIEQVDFAMRMRVLCGKFHKSSVEIREKWRAIRPADGQASKQAVATRAAVGRAATPKFLNFGRERFCEGRQRSHALLFVGL